MTLISLIILPFAGVLAGLLGALIGIGGGIIVVPTLILGFGIDVKVAVATSLVAVIASSTSAGSVYVGKGLTNMRLGMILEVATTLGGIAGGLVAMMLPDQAILGLFSLIMFAVSALMFKKKEALNSSENFVNSIDEIKESATHGVYFDPFHKKYIEYKVKRTGLGAFVSGIAGMLSGLLGVGGGFIKVPVMTLAMGMPMKVAAATSNFMIGVTAISSLFIYFMKGYVEPMIAAPVAIGVTLGAFYGTKVAAKISPNILRKIFAGLAIVVAIQMLVRAIGGSFGNI